MNQGLNETERYAMDELNRLRQWYETASKPYFDMLVRERRMRMPDRFLFVPDDDTRPFQGMKLDQMWIDESEQVTLPAPRISSNPGETSSNPGETSSNPGETSNNPGETSNNPGETSSAWMEGFNAAIQWREDVERWMFGGYNSKRPEAPSNPYKAGQE